MFTPAEVEEIRTYNEEKLPLMTSDLKDHLLAFNKSNAKDIRNVLKDNNTFDDNFDADKDWINCTMYSILRQYEAGNMMKPHYIDAVVGKSVSHASRKRKNANRHISSLRKIDPVQFGHRLDMIFRQSVAGQSEAREFGGSEAGINDSGGCGTKYLYERILYENMPNTYHMQYNQLRTVGFIHSGLNSQMISLDRPTMYVSRVTSYKSISIGTQISQFNSLIPAIYSAWVCRKIVVEVMNRIKSLENNFLDLDTCLLNIPPPLTPVTSSSTETTATSKKLSKKMKIQDG
ncbi:unnamed protein product [Mucor hiemalis]